jgi:hypothetical protein
MVLDMVGRIVVVVVPVVVVVGVETAINVLRSRILSASTKNDETKVAHGTVVEGCERTLKKSKARELISASMKQNFLQKHTYKI